MDEIIVKKVASKKELDDFIHVVDIIYQNCPQYVPDFESDVKDIFDSRKNSGLEFSNVQPFVAYQGNKAVGRIVGIVNHRANEKWKTHNVRFSMIEFLDDLAISKALLNSVEEWGRSYGMDSIQGPLGITDFDKEGMLIEDFDMLGSIITIYNPEYYPRHMEALGFKKEADWVQIRVNVPKEVPVRYARVAQYAKEQVGLRVLTLTDKDITKRQYGRKIFKLLNEAYSPLFGFSEISDQQIDEFVAKYLQLIDKQLMPVVINDKGELVGATVTMGSLARATQKAKGKLLPFDWFHLLKALKWKHEDTVEMLLIGVRPDYQGLGVNAMFFNHLIPIYNKYGFKWAETGPQLEDNFKELSQWKVLNPEYIKRRRCYIKTIQ
ncbi:MAG: N-acetyltransferase [Prevotella sp.]|nr:N-acetyltransferase [Prevotella sp.]